MIKRNPQYKDKNQIPLKIGDEIGRYTSVWDDHTRCIPKGLSSSFDPERPVVRIPQNQKHVLIAGFLNSSYLNTVRYINANNAVERYWRF